MGRNNQLKQSDGSWMNWVRCFWRSWGSEWSDRKKISNRRDRLDGLDESVLETKSNGEDDLKRADVSKMSYDSDSH